MTYWVDGKPVYHLPPTHQTDATLNQAAPVATTWYTILDTTRYARIINITIRVNTVGETLECRIIVDGVTLTSQAFAAAAGTNYGVVLQPSAVIANSLWIQVITSLYSFLIEGKSIKVDVRKTTAAGAGNLLGIVTYAVWP